MVTLEVGCDVLKVGEKVLKKAPKKEIQLKSTEKSTQKCTKKQCSSLIVQKKALYKCSKK